MSNTGWHNLPDLQYKPILSYFGFYQLYLIFITKTFNNSESSIRVMVFAVENTNFISSFESTCSYYSSSAT